MSDGDVNNELENMVEFTFRLEKRLTPRERYSFIIINCQNAIEQEVTVHNNKIYNVDCIP